MVLETHMAPAPGPGHRSIPPLQAYLQKKPDVKNTKVFLKARKTQTVEAILQGGLS